MTQLHSEQDAIKQAVEAGWKSHIGTTNFRILYGIDAKVFDPEANIRIESAEGGSSYRCFAEIAQDPAFWQALGKARGFKTTNKFWTKKLCSGCGNESAPYECCGEEIPMWQYQALRYFEIGLSGGDTKDFWQTLP